MYTTFNDLNFVSYTINHVWRIKLFQSPLTYSFRSCAHGVKSREHDHESIWIMLESQLDYHPSPEPTPPTSLYSQASPVRAFYPVPSLILTGATAGFQTWNEGSPQMIPARGVPMQISPFIWVTTTTFNGCQKPLLI